MYVGHTQVHSNGDCDGMNDGARDGTGVGDVGDIDSIAVGDKSKSTGLPPTLLNAAIKTLGVSTHWPSASDGFAMAYTSAPTACNAVFASTLLEAAP